MRSDKPDAGLYGIPAEVALLALRAILPHGVKIGQNRVRFPPELTVLTDPEAVQRLSVFPKPLQCASTASGESMALQCAPIADEERWRYEHNLQMLRDGLGLVSDMLLREGEDDSVLVLGRDGERMVVPANVIHQFERDYLILGHYFANGNVLDRNERGASILLKFAPATGEVTSSAPSEELFELRRTRLNSSVHAIPFGLHCKDPDHPPRETHLHRRRRG